MTNDKVSDQAKRSKTHVKIYTTLSVVFTIAVVLLAVLLVPKGVPFWAFTVEDIVRLLTGLAIIALFIERAIEVLMAA